MAHASKVEKAHNVLAAYLAPRLQPGVKIDCRPFFVGVDDRNIAANLSSIVGAVCRATAGELAMDANVPELHKKMKQAVEDDGTTTTKEASGVDQSIIDKVMTLLEARLTHSELCAVKQILTAKPKRQEGPARNPEEIGEDARNAQLALDAYAARFPNAAKIRVEPSTAPAPQQHAASSASDYFKRFPDARRIGL